MSKKQYALFTILILSGLTIGLMLRLDIIGFTLGTVGGISSGLWALYDIEDREGKDAKSV